MKELLVSSPLIILLILALGIIIFILFFNFLGRSPKWAAISEKIYLGILMFTVTGATGVTIMPFNKINPVNLYNLETTPPTIIGLLAFYIAGLILLSSRLRYTLKNFFNVIVLLITQDPFFCTFIVLISLSGFWSQTLGYTFRTSIVVIIWTFYFIYIGKQFHWEEIYRILRWITLFTVLLSIYYATFNPSIGVHPAGWMGILGHKNQFSFYMALSAVVWLLNAINNPKQRRWSIVVVILAFYALNKGGSGASKVLTVVLLSLWGYLGFVKKLKPQWAFVSVLLFIIVSVCLSILITDNLEFIVVDTLNKDMTITGRTDFWPLVIDKINSEPLLGYGMNGFWQPWRGKEFDPGGSIIVAKTQFVPPHAHNGFLDLALDLGWLGLALYLFSFFSSIAKGVLYLGRSQGTEAGLPLLLLTYIVMTNLTETGLHGMTGHWMWFVIITTRVNMDASVSSLSEHSRVQKPAYYEGRGAARAG